MKMTFCDIKGCKGEAYHEVDVCMGYTSSSSDSGVSTHYEPFERSQILKRDLCTKHYRKWCECTYNFLLKESKKD
jgi:hypothetical protein